MSAKTQQDEAHDKVHAEIFRRVNGLESKFDETNGYLRGIVESNEKLIDLLKSSQTQMKWALGIVATLAFFALAALVYGAIGKEGLHSVRQAMPSGTLAAIPAHNDFDKWRGRHRS